MKIDGNKIAGEIIDDLKQRIKKLEEKDITPMLAIIIVGENPASLSYVRQKELKAKNVGIKTTIVRLPETALTDKLIKVIQQFSNDNNAHGIIVQQPLPPQINLEQIINAIDPKKDVDGFRLNSLFQMPIAMAVLKILEKVYSYTPRGQSQKRESRQNLQKWLRSKNIVIIGKGETGGKPIIQMLEGMIIPLTIIDCKTKNPKFLTKEADIIISAVGKANILKPQMIKRGVVLISIGISRRESAKLTGDYDQNQVKNIASFYTPTPGGVGPINVAMLLKNLISAAEIQHIDK